MKSLVRIGTGSLTVIITQFITNAVMNKVIAVYCGVAAYAQIGSIQNQQQIILPLSGQCLATGVTRFTSRNRYHHKKLKYHVANSLFYSILLCLVVLSLCIVLYVSSDFFDSLYILVYVALLPLVVVHNWFLSILNGLGEAKRYLKISLITVLSNFTITTVLTVGFSTHGTLIAIAINQAVASLITILFYLRKFEIFDVAYIRFNQSIFKKYLKYGCMTFVSLSTIPLAIFLLRLDLIEKYGEVLAGQWDAMLRLSIMYSLVITSFLSIVYLPKITNLRCDVEIVDLQYKFIKYVSIFAIPFFGVIFLLKGFVVELLFTQEFLGMLKFFTPQLTGDFFKILTWVVMCYFVTKGVVINHILLNLVFGLLFFLMAKISLNFSSNISIGYALSQVLSFIFSLLVVSRFVKNASVKYKSKVKSSF
ncbi:oligosaccharide flippase family protein [Shewanella gelidii]|uniref:oligosaccharide flippase family protein n=1 Tax=Shewanella gelidii TaxID=1642821 RepID=UPI0016692712|nr:oligosaccharide flippase family protein [Shewanella gelidii]MCL1096429.1 oligosaccharide flippase family protein [Shewanella gelidii]